MARIRKAVSSGVHPDTRKTVWLIAAYIRLSREDGNDESLSVTNQKKIIGEYLENFFEGEFMLVDYYIDGADIIGLNAGYAGYPGKTD